MPEHRTTAWSIRPFTPQDRVGLVQMYTHFEPKRAAQGLPPADPRRLNEWLDDVLGRGIHLLAMAGHAIIAHVMLIPVEDNTVELANFVDLHWRNQGLGTALNNAAVEVARSSGWTRVWLSVDPSNRAAVRSYSRAGFKPIDGRAWAPELEMVIDLAADHHTTAGNESHDLQDA